MKLSSSGARRAALGIGTAIVLSAAAVGMAGAQQPPAGTATPSAQQARPRAQAFLDALASRLGITTDTLQQAIEGARTDVGAPAGKPGHGFPGIGGRGFGGPGPGMHMVRGGLDMNVLTQALGISAEQLRQELPGQTLAQVAQAHGKNPTDVANALKDAANQRIDQAVANGRLTDDQATQLKERAAEQVDRLMNETRPAAGTERPRRGGSGGPAPSSQEGTPATQS